MHQAPLQTWDTQTRERHQGERLAALFTTLREHNPFYRDKWAGINSTPSHPADLASLPLTTKAELLTDQARHPPFGRNLTRPASEYIRLHQTSGTTGVPLRVLDDPVSWDWWAECWRYIFDAAGVCASDRVMLAFSFGPFIGFWSAQEGLVRLGAMALTGGGMSSQQRLAMIRDLEATVLICTPSYAIHLGEVARAEGLDPYRDLKVRVTLHAGEPGAGIPATRERIESLWGAEAVDHAGASEIGAWSFSCSARNGLHIIESEYVAEVIDPDTGTLLPEGKEGELVLTNLGRTSFPVVRYRTGDIVKTRPRGTCSCGRTTLVLEGGVLGRTDNMVTVRGVNVFPSAFQSLFDRFEDIGEHRVTAYRLEAMDELHVEFETDVGRDRCGEVAQAIRQALGIRISLEQLPPDSLPRFEMKAKRFFDRREHTWQPGSSNP